MLDIQSSSAPQFFGLPYLHMVIDEDKIVAFSDRVPVQRKDEPKRDRPINRDPTNADRSLQLFLLHILPLCNVWQHWNTCASRVMQVSINYVQVNASHPITLNKSPLKILAHVSLNANCLIFTSGCLLLFTFNYTFMAQKLDLNILQWTQETLTA